MAKMCAYVPTRKGEVLDGWFEYKKTLGYKKATKVFSISVAPSYMEQNKDVLQLDSQGVPTLTSTLRTPYMKKFLSEQERADALDKKYKFHVVDNTADNFRMLVNEAKNFNSNEEDFIAYVEKQPKGLRIVVHPKSEKALQTFNDQYGSMVLNDRLLEIFEPLGITPEILSSAELNGSTGITDFSKAKAIAGQFVGLIKVAQGIEGQMALSEEFSHIIVRALSDQPLIQRLISAYSQNIPAMQELLGGEYISYEQEYTDENGNIDYAAIAEECVGRKLQRSLLDNKDTQPKSFIDRLFERVKRFIYSLVRNLNSGDVDAAIVNADQTIDDLAKSILTGSTKISQSDIENNRVDKVMHHLEATIDSLEGIIQDAIVTETKKTKILKDDQLLNQVEIRKAALEAVQNGTPAGQLQGLLNYAKSAFKDLSQAEQTLRRMSMQDANVFTVLRSIRMVIQSYDSLISQLRQLTMSDNQELVDLIRNTAINNADGTVETLQSLYTQLNELNLSVKDRFQDLALNSFENFLKPFFEEESFIDRHGKRQTLREAIEEANGDISFFDRWLQTMSTSGDIILQMFDAVVKKAKNRARQQTIKDIGEIAVLQQEAEDAGITDFDYMFERDNEGHKTGNYISDVNYGQHKKDYDEMIRETNERYGEHPRGRQSIEKKNARVAWIREHSQSLLEPEVPNPTKYHNPEYDKLSAKQREILNKYKELKQKFDRRYPQSRVNKMRAIQRRKTTAERRLSLLNPTQVVGTVMESFKKDFMSVSDDDQEFGVRTGLRDFSGKEHMVLPVLYSTPISNPDDLSTDVFGSLAAYSYASNVYANLENVVDPLEIGRQVVTEQRKIGKVSDSKPVVEKVNNAVQRIFQTGGSNIEAKLNDFMESQVYGRYYKDSDTTINIGKQKIKTNKAVNKFLSISSVAQLGCNWLANAANLFTGIGMIHIEAFCGQFFNAKELAKADGVYLKEVMSYIPELEAKNKNSKLALFDEMFDVKQDFKDKAGRSRDSRFLKRIFGETVVFLGQTCGDHWLYNRTAIAMALRTKVYVNGRETTLWDALEVKDRFQGNDKIKMLKLPSGTRDANGKIIDQDWIGKWSESVKYINHRLFGVYNSDDMVAAERTAAGRMLLQFRKWIVPQMAARFDGKKYILAINDYTEGYYRTLLNFAIGLKTGQGNIMQQWGSMEDWQKRNIIRCVVEMVQFAALWCLGSFLVGHDDDPESFWNNKWLEYFVQREIHELGNLTPSLTMGREILKTINSPVAAINSAQSVLDVLGSIIDPRDWNNELQTGNYKGHSTLYKHIMKAPLPILPQFRQADRFLNGVEDAALYYVRGF